MRYQQLLYSILLCSINLFSQERPNIIFIMSDDHSYRAIGAYNRWVRELQITPHIDQLANEGVMFTNALCTNSLCAPSRASIISGMYSHWNGVYTLREEMDGSYLPLLAKGLRKAGYTTGVVGKWHLEGDNLQGYDRYAITRGQGSYWDPSLETKDGSTKYSGYTTDVYTDIALDWIDSMDPSNPFFLMIHHKAAHSPWFYDTIKHADFLSGVILPEPFNLMDDYTDRFESGVPHKQHKIHDYLNPTTTNKDILSKDFTDTTWVTGAIDTAGMTQTQILKASYQKYIHDYLTCIKSVDDNVGRVIAKLRENGLLNNTIIIYTSDQGMFLGEHNFYDKRLGLEEGMRIPLIISYPKRVPRDSVMDHLVNLVDFAPTFLDFAGAKIPTQMQGISFKDLLYGNQPDTVRQSSFYHFYSSSCPKHIGLRTKKYKMLMYLRKKNGDLLGYDLYDLKNDPFEMHNIYYDPAYGEVVKMMHEKLKTEMASIAFGEGLYPGKDQKNIDRRLVVELRDANGMMIPYGSVIFNDSSSFHISEQGYVSIFNVLPGTYPMTLIAEGYHSRDVEVKIDPRIDYKAANDTLISIALEPLLYTLNIRIISDGNPVEGARLTIPESTFVTDVTGHVEIKELKRGIYPICIEAIGYQSINDTLSITEENMNLTYEMTAIPTVSFSSQVYPVSIYPNPSKNQVFIEGGRIGSSIKLVNMSGMVLMDAEISSDHEILPLTELPSGSYSILIEQKYIGNIVVGK